MVFIRYSREQLFHLRQSHLVQRPDALPAIEQWMEYVITSFDLQISGRLTSGRTNAEGTTNGRRKTQSGRGDDALADGPLQRPLLGTRQSTRGTSGGMQESWVYVSTKN